MVEKCMKNLLNKFILHFKYFVIVLTSFPLQVILFNQGNFCLVKLSTLTQFMNNSRKRIVAQKQQTLPKCTFMKITFKIISNLITLKLGLKTMAVSLNFIEELAILQPILYKRYWTRLQIVFNNFSHSTADFAYCGCLGELFRNQSSSILSQNVVYFLSDWKQRLLEKIAEMFYLFIFYHLLNSHIHISP